MEDMGLDTWEIPHPMLHGNLADISLLPGQAFLDPVAEAIESSCEGRNKMTAS